MSELLERLSQAHKEGWDEWILSEADERAVAAGYRFDLQSAKRVQTFFQKFLRHSKGQWAGQPFGLLDWQWREIVAQSSVGYVRWHASLPPGLHRGPQEKREISPVQRLKPVSVDRPTKNLALRFIAPRWIEIKLRLCSTKRPTW